jgi:hypothetical protein
MTTANRLRSWYRQIPTMVCLPGCHDCCEGYAPSMLRIEWTQIGHPGKISTGTTFTSCPFLGEAGCEIYPRRPLICRVFGTVNRRQADALGAFKAYCPRGGAPDNPLPVAQALRIQADYEGLLWTEACSLITRFIAYLRGPREDTLPRQYEYLRYLFSTQDGQRGLALLMGIDGEPGLHPDQIDRLQDIMRGDTCSIQ